MMLNLSYTKLVKCDTTIRTIRKYTYKVNVKPHVSIALEILPFQTIKSPNVIVVLQLS